jgi:hypothetical protein
LAAGGTYTLLVEGSRLDTGAASYTFVVSPQGNIPPPPPPAGTALVLGATVSGSIGASGESDIFSFSLPSDARLYFDSFTNDSSLRWTLAGPAGTAVSDRSLASTDAIEGSGLLGLVAGEYTLTLNGAGAATGGYSFRLLDLAAATPLTVGTPVSGALTPASETDAYRFDAAAGDRVFLDVTARSGAPNARWRALDPFGNVMFERDFGGTGSDAGPFTLGAPGTYTVLVEGRVFEGGAGSYTLRVAPVVDAPPIPLNPPAPTVAIALQTGSDLGALATDRLTSDTTPTFDVTVNRPGTIGVDFNNDGTADQTQSAGQAGTFAFTAPALADGTRQVVAIFSATAGPTVTDDLTLTIDTAGPRVSSSDGPQALAPLSTFAVHFDEPIDAATLTLADIGITGPGATPIAPTSIIGAGADWVVHFAPQTAVGVYTVTVGPDVADLAGNAMNQDGDAANGESGADRFAGAVEIAPRIQVFWAGGGDGVSWSDPLNWGAHGLPGAGDDVVLDVPGVTVVYNLAASTIGSLVIAADTVLSLTGGTLGLLTASSVEGGLVLAGGSLDADEGLSVAAGGLVGGTGTIEGDLANAGILRPGSSPGLLVITGDFFQAPNGVLQVEFNGNEPGVGYDQVLVTGHADLGGTLDIRRDLLFDPDVFERFEVLTYASVAGDFAAFTGRAIDTAKVFRPDRELTVYALTVDVNVPPTASPDLLVTLEDTPSPPLDALVNDVDVDAEGPLEIIAFTQGAHGTVTQDVLGRFVYTPLPNAFGTDAFAYTVRDDVGAIDVASVTVTIDPVNDPPAAADDVAQTIEATAVDIAVLANDADLDGDTLAVSEFTQGQSGTVSANGDGTLRYTPTAGFLGTDHFTYTVSDGAGGSDSAEVAVSVVAGNRPPVASDDTAITGEDTTSASIDVLGNDTDPDGDVLTLAGFTHGAHGVVAPDAFGGLVYTPDPDFSGTDTFTYSVQDPDGLADDGQVTVTITPSRDAPVAVDDIARTGRGTAVDVAVLANDVVDGPGGVIIAFTQGAHGQVIDLGGGVLRYLPAAGFAGEDTFTYTMTDDLGPSDAAEVRLTVIDGMLWDGGGDGVSWGDPFNWLPDVLPTASDDVVIDLAAADPTITVGFGQFAVRRLFSTENIVMAGAP